MTTNESLNQLNVYRNLKCVKCFRTYPDTILNIEGYLHHNLPIQCLNQQDCKKAKNKAHGKCSLCSKPFNNLEIVLGNWKFHPDCYQVVVQRLAHFMELLLLPEDEFNAWLENEV